jgi:two-component system response regulator NreC
MAVTPTIGTDQSAERVSADVPLDAGRDATAGLEPIRVLVVDDHAVVRAGLRLLLERKPGLTVVGEAAVGQDAILANRSLEPDVVVMDLVMPGMNGVEATRIVLAERPGAKVLVLSMQDDPHFVREAFDAGAAGYVLKESADTELVAAIRHVAAGGRHVDPALGARLFAADSHDGAKAERNPLSEREREVLRLLALGHTNQEIARLLSISIRTAETHRAHIMQKLRASTRAELVRYALGVGLLDVTADPERQPVAT